VQTAEIVARVLNLPINIVDALREPDCGEMEGRSDEAAWAEHQRVMVDWLLHEKFDSRIAGGESCWDVRARFVPFVEQLIAQHAHTDHNLLLITHSSLLYMMLSEVLSNIDLAFAREQPMPNTAVIVAEQRDDGLKCVEWCGVKI
jgi:broad specificity phosphatase PhoE